MMTLLYPLILTISFLVICLFLFKNHVPKKIIFFAYPSAFLGLKNPFERPFVIVLKCIQAMVFIGLVITLAVPAKKIEQKADRQTDKTHHLIIDFNSLYTRSDEQKNAIKQTLIKPYIEHIKPNAICLWALSDTLYPIFPCSPNHLYLINQLDHMPIYARPHAPVLNELPTFFNQKSGNTPPFQSTFLSFDDTTALPPKTLLDALNPSKHNPLIFLEASHLFQINEAASSNVFTIDDITSKTDHVVPFYLKKDIDFDQALSFISPAIKQSTKTHLYSYQKHMLFVLCVLLLLEIGILSYGKFQNYL